MSLEKKREFKPLPRYPIQGDLNAHYSYADESGDVYLLRVPRNNPKIKEIIRREIKQWGFNKAGGRITVRTPQEQLEFEKNAYLHGLRVLPTVSDETGESYKRLLANAVTFDEYLPGATDADAERTIKELFEDVGKAHQLGIVYGDRWPKNILVDPIRGVMNIDFDIELIGPAKELELAQLIFYTLASDPKRSARALKPILEHMLPEYEYGTVRNFVMRKARKSHKKYGDLTETAEELFRSLPEKPSGTA